MRLGRDYKDLRFHGLSIFWAVALLLPVFSACATPRSAARSASCSTARVMTWAAEWLEPQDLEPSLEQLRNYGIVWSRELAFDAEKSAFKLVEHPVFTQVNLELAPEANACKGALIHNSGPGGFDPKLGTRILAVSDAELQQLRKIVHLRKWQVLQVDLESLPEASAADYERFLDRLIKVFEGTSVHLSVVLHAKTSHPGDYEGARFQRWENLARKPLDFVLMAYDFHWETSEPGPVAPWDWVHNVAQFARLSFPEDRLVIALPLYGYHWKKQKKTGWKGTAELAPALKREVSARKWKRTALRDAADGQSYTLNASERIYFDDATSAALKLGRLQRGGFRRFALWRWGADPKGELFRSPAWNPESPSNK